MFGDISGMPGVSGSAASVLNLIYNRIREVVDQMRLLIDAVPVGSGGLLQLRDELSAAIAKTAPPGSKVMLLTAKGSEETRNSDILTTIPVRKLRWGWLGLWWWHNKRLPGFIRQQKADVVYSLSGILAAPTRRAAATVTTVNNMVPFSPAETASLPFWSRQRLRYWLLRHLYVNAVRRADSVVLHSRHALEQVSRHAGDISGKVAVVLTGVPTDIGALKQSDLRHPETGKPYLLYFTAFYPYKNHLRVIEAYERGLASDPELPELVFAGTPSDPTYFATVMKALDRPAIRHRVRYVGKLERKEVPAWIANATLNIFASTCETNPVTVAEILGLGAAMICSNTHPIPEIVGDAGEYFDPTDVRAISEAMTGVLRREDRRQSLRKLARKRADELSWDACGAEIWRAARLALVSRQRTS